LIFWGGLSIERLGLDEVWKEGEGMRVIDYLKCRQKNSCHKANYDLKPLHCKEFPYENGGRPGWSLGYSREEYFAV